MHSRDTKPRDQIAEKQQNTTLKIQQGVDTKMEASV
jgi:hypothetical protein